METNVKNNEPKCSRITKNPFFNFMRCYRAMTRNQCKPSRELTRAGAKAWKRLSEKERDVYRKMAEPYLKHPRSRSCTPSSQPGSGTPRTRRRPRSRRGTSRNRRTQRTTNRRSRARKSRSRTTRRRPGRRPPRRRNSGVRRLQRRRAVSARPRQKPKSVCSPPPGLTRTNEETATGRGCSFLSSNQVGCISRCSSPSNAPVKTVHDTLSCPNSPGRTATQVSTATCSIRCGKSASSAQSQSHDTSCGYQSAEGTRSNEKSNSVGTNIDCCRPATNTMEKIHFGRLNCTSYVSSSSPSPSNRRASTSSSCKNSLDSPMIN